MNIIANNIDDLKNKPNYPGVITFASSSIIYDKLNEYKMLPYFDDYKEYIFSTLVQTLVNSLLYDDYKLILLDNIMVAASIFAADNI